MMQQDLESHGRQRQEAQEKHQKSMMEIKRLDTLLVHYKTQLDVHVQKNKAFQEEKTALDTELQALKPKMNRERQQVFATNKKLKECQEEVEMKESQLQNQKDTIHRLQNSNITMTEKLALTESLYKESKKEVGIATDLFNELSVKFTQLEFEHTNTHQVLNQAVRERDSTINGLRVSNNKMVKKAVEQAKLLKKLNNNVKVTFQVDKATTEEVMREGYSDLQKFLETKALQMEHILALVAYALTHLKFVIERFVTERVDGSKVSVVCDFFNQVMNQITRIFLIIPVPIMLRNIDRLTELASEQCVSIKALHMIQYLLPQTAEDAQASRQRVILENFPHLSEFFTRASSANDDTVCMSVTGFMMLIGISK